MLFWISVFFRLNSRPNKINFILSTPKFTLNLLKTNQSNNFEKFLKNYVSSSDACS